MQVRTSSNGRVGWDISVENPVLNGELPEDLPSQDDIQDAKSRFTLMVNPARRERHRLWQLIFRTESTETTLRGHYGLTWVGNHSSATAEVVVAG
ncbi:hypothetical protein OG874_16440 [Nocardia sp. NBC_00565]|uniref:hypothetical protein n=1 Tax=Nocardia sp. NBC_00565 TaxID=2975993 RepID=UPI002E8186FB|nr:hypothetical protein [Nocardia sp. NBC_00565]WUC06608.1 hypothetical protein OG874_16440 [Nocardia sp. NBC_00565]